MPDTVLLEERDGICIVTVNRPHVRNAMDRPAAEALSQRLDDLDARSDVRVGILTGAGGTFCAGMDLKALAATGERPISRGRGPFGIVERRPAKPLIAAVEGHAVGGGLEIALACDMIVAAEDALLGLPEVKRGIIAAAGGLLRLPQRLPHNIAMELVLTGELLPATRAHELGLVNRLVPPGAALAAACKLAARVAANAPLAVTTSKRVLIEAREWPMEEAYERQQPFVEKVRLSKDAREGTRAFAEKRPPVWSGS